jgi:class 3 adenylate cyclase
VVLTISPITVPFAVFRLPNDSDNDAANAWRCAEIMLDALDSWSAERIAGGGTPVAIGIGLNYGPAIDLRLCDCHAVRVAK